MTFSLNFVKLQVEFNKLEVVILWFFDENFFIC